MEATDQPTLPSPPATLPMPGAEVEELKQKLADTRLNLRIAIAGLKELEDIYFDFSRKSYDLVEIRAILSTTLRQLGAAKRIRNRDGEVTA